MAKYPSIFTQVLGPVGPGPSSSSTCGMARVGYLAHQIFNGVPEKARIKLPRAGVFPGTWQGMRSDIALLTGLLGREQTHPRFIRAYEDAKTEGLSFETELVDWEIDGTCQLLGIEMAGKDREGRTLSLSVEGDSTGGGTCLIRKINDCSLDIRGDQHELLLFFNGTAGEKEVAMAACQAAPSLNQALWAAPEKKAAGDTEGKIRGIIQLKLGAPLPGNIRGRLGGLPGVELARDILPVHPVVLDIRRRPPFATPEEFEAYCGQRKCQLWEAAAAYESALSGWSAEEVLAYAESLWQTIGRSIEKGLEGSFDMNGVMEPTAHGLERDFSLGKWLDLGILNTALPAALGVMEYSNASGTVVYLPTGGSSGILPGTLRGAKRAFGAADEDMAKALLVAGMIGVFMAEDNNFSGCQYGCQAEVGCAAAMAAGALTHFLGGTAHQACDSAAMALQSMLGLICDTVAGLVQVPCLARNIAGTAVAYACANSVMAGFPVVIGLREMTGALKEVGRELVKIGMRGACTSPEGKRLAREQEKRNPRLRR